METKIVTVLVKEWRTGAESGWVDLRQEQANAKITPKRAVILDGRYKGKVFDRESGKEVTSYHSHWYRYDVKVPV